MGRGKGWKTGAVDTKRRRSWDISSSSEGEGAPPGTPPVPSPPGSPSRPCSSHRPSCPCPCVSFAVPELTGEAHEPLIPFTTQQFSVTAVPSPILPDKGKLPSIEKGLEWWAADLWCIIDTIVGWKKPMRPMNITSHCSGGLMEMCGSKARILSLAIDNTPCGEVTGHPPNVGSIKDVFVNN